MTNGEKSRDEKIRELGIDIKRLEPIAQTAALAASTARGVIASKVGEKKEVVVKGLERFVEREKSGAGYVLGAILIFLFDFFTRRFGGLDVDAILKNLSSVSYIISVSLTNGIVIFVLFIYFFMRGREVTKEEFISFFLFIEVAYLCFVLGGPSAGVLVHIGFAIYTWFMLKGDLEDPSTPSKWVAFLLFFDFFGISLMGWAGAKYGVDVLSVFGNRVINPVWLLFSLFYTSTKYRGRKPWWLSIAVSIVIAFYILTFMGESFVYAAYAKGLSQKDIRQAETIASKAWSNAKKFGIEVAYSINRDIGTGFERLISTGAGPYYGYAEETEQVGIFLEVEEPEAPVATKASFYAEVEAKTLGIVESIPVSAKCWWGEEYEEGNEGVITPSKVEIFDGESETFRCKFDALDPEAEEISFEVSASGLESTGELPVFFIDEELKRVMKKKGEDLFFGYYAGRSLDPRMTYTNGPLGIETTALNQPISLGGEDVNKVLGIRLRNLWDKGEISSINSLEVRLPRGVELSDCDYQFTQKSDEGHNIYSFDTSEFVPLKEINEEAYFLCDMTIKISEKSDLMSGPVKAHPRFFYINVTYDFKIKDSVSIEVIGADKKEVPSLPPAKEVTHESERIDNYLQSKGAPWAGQGQCMVDASRRTGVPVILMLALPKQEGEWSGRELQKGYCPESCKPGYTNPHKISHNLFSIKTTSGWDGDSCWWRTWEEIDGRDVWLCDDFRAYDNYCESINDFADIVSTNSRYSEAMDHKDDPERMVEEMLKGGWATDSEWANKVINIMREINSEMS